MDVTFLGHSGFLVRLASAALLFDWSEGELPALEPEVPLLVFASHGHEDHFQPAIFRQQARAWLLGKDIRLSPRNRPSGWWTRPWSWGPTPSSTSATAPPP